MINLLKEKSLNNGDLLELKGISMDKDQDLGKFTPIAVECLISDGHHLAFDLFIFLSHKRLLYMRKGELLDHSCKERLRKFRQTKQKLYIHSDDWEIFQKFVDQLTDGPFSDLSAAEVQEKSAQINYVVDQGLNTLYEAGSTETSSDDEVLERKFEEKDYQLVLKGAKGLRKIVSQRPEVLQQLFFQRNRDHSILIEHSKRVCMLAARLGFKAGLNSEELDDLSTAALVHDIGHLAVVTSMSSQKWNGLFKNNKNAFENPNDLHLYQEHLLQAQHFLADRPYVRPRVLDLVLAHEAKIGGAGHPKDIVQLDLGQQILSLCNYFDKLMMVNNFDVNLSSSQLMEEEIGHYELKLLKGLQQLVTKELPKNWDDQSL